MFIFSVLCVICEGLCDLINPWVLSKMVDDGAAKGDMDIVIKMGLLMLGIVLTGAAFAVARNVLSSIASQSFGADLRADMYKKILSLRSCDMDSFEGGSLVTRMTNDITQLTNFVNGMMRIFFKAPVVCVGGIVMSYVLNPLTLYIVMPVVLVVSVVIFFSMKLAYPSFARVQEALDKLNTMMREYLMGIRLVKAFRRFKNEENRFSASNNRLSENSTRANRIIAVFSPCMQMTVNLGIVAIVFAGARWVDTENMQVGQVMAFITYLGRILMSLTMISNVLNMFVRNKTSVTRIAEVMNLNGEDSFVKACPDAKATENYIEFDNVSFSYESSTGQAALNGITFSLKKGRTLGIIGSTGSGKSTLASLLMKFYTATAGEIRLNGTPIESFSAEELRKHVAIAPQLPMLFTGTVSENLRWGNENADDSMLAQAARDAQADVFINSLAQGYDTLIGQSGVNFSGGQKQRLSIARALLRDPDLLILDDCTSALDTITEARVKHELKKYTGRLTCVLITQRISTAMTCDEILVLDNGRQVGFGSNADLLKSCEVYHDIYLSQIGKEAV